MKNTYILLLFIFGMALVLGGAYMKIEKIDHAKTVLGVGIMIEGATGLFLILKILKGNNGKGFLDS